MREKPSHTQSGSDLAKRLLESAPVVRSACELDLLLFLQRHPRTLLTSEQLAAFVGYDMNRVGKAVESFIEAGLLERTQNAKHAARMYVLVLDGPQGGGLQGLVEMASTCGGRRLLLAQLGSRRSGNGSVRREPLQKNRSIHAIA